MTVRIDPYKLREARDAAGLTQAQLADKIGEGWTNVKISQLERGLNVDITLTGADVLAKALGVTSAQLEAKGKAASSPLPPEPRLDPDKLRKARKAARLTQHQLAERTGFSQSLIASLESGKTTVSLESVKSLADILGVSIYYLLGNVEEDVAQHNIDPHAAILSNYTSPGGLRDLASDNDLLKAIKVRPDEWRALSSLASAWQDAEMARKEGWLAILSVMRAVHR